MGKRQPVPGLIPPGSKPAGPRRYVSSAIYIRLTSTERALLERAAECKEPLADWVRGVLIDSAKLTTEVSHG